MAIMKENTIEIWVRNGKTLNENSHNQMNALKDTTLSFKRTNWNGYKSNLSFALLECVDRVKRRTKPLTD